MREEDKRLALIIEEIENKLARLLSAGYLTEENKVSLLKEILALAKNEETEN